MYLMEVAEK